MHLPGTKTIQYVVGGQQNYPNNIKFKIKKITNENKILQLRTKETVVSFGLVKMQYEVLDLPLDASQLELS